MKVDPKTASEIIKPRLLDHDVLAAGEPIDVHRQIYLTQICHFLHLEASARNLERVALALVAYGIETDNFQEYPKAVDDRVVASKEEHDAVVKDSTPAVEEKAQAERDPYFYNPESDKRETAAA
jgi:hypothetical protein